MFRPRFWIAALVGLGLLAQNVAARTPVKPGFNLISPQQELQLGRQLAAQADRQLPLVTDPGLTQRVSAIGWRLARHSPAPNYPYVFKVVRDNRINAFALPGGPIYVNSGTISAAGNDAQLAGVLAHEIAHVALRHATNQASKAMLAQVPLGILGGILGSGSRGGQLAQMGIGFGVNSLFLKYSRDAERQADLLGVRIMNAAGYDPEQMVRFFEKIQGSERGRSIEFLSDHPNPGNRIALLENEINSLGSRPTVTEQRRFRRMR